MVWSTQVFQVTDMERTFDFEDLALCTLVAWLWNVPGHLQAESQSSWGPVYIET